MKFGMEVLHVKINYLEYLLNNYDTLWCLIDVNLIVCDFEWYAVDLNIIASKFRAFAVELKN